MRSFQILKFKKISVIIFQNSIVLFQNMKLISLKYSDLCAPREGIDKMVVLVVIEVILLVIAISKLIYDIRHYNRTGELPWLARHICLEVSYSGMKSANQNHYWQPPAPRNDFNDRGPTSRRLEAAQVRMTLNCSYFTHN